jgi:hypothetical protein
VIIVDLNAQKTQSVKLLRNSIFSKINSMLKEKSETINTYDTGENEDLIESINDAKKEWLSARNNFEQAVESDIVDYYVYKIKAYQIRYEYLLKKAKEKGISI